MYRLKSSKLSGKRVIIVEAERDVVEIMEDAVADASGVVIFRAGNLDQAMTELEHSPHIDCMMVDVDTVASSDTPVVKACAERGVEVVVVAWDDSYIR
ncbi:hypothetical protein [Aureimonas glaciei]|uniref:Uncharacterized protein n=1 Tax=Aureimonas glaciei TaxID=1776957 RepID=A0A916YB38_9HYPH|nr:hypothetical protein [Aureimonas glaciei]GGD38245.1 hypothetical protein GCM10011335_46200 [Aureimonas glaciei]